MQSMAQEPASAKATGEAQTIAWPGVVRPSQLLAAFASVPDPRRRQGTRFALSAMLALAVAAILANHLSVLAIAQWGARQGRDLLSSLGFPDGVTPPPVDLAAPVLPAQSRRFVKGPRRPLGQGYVAK